MPEDLHFWILVAKVLFLLALTGTFFILLRPPRIKAWRPPPYEPPVYDMRPRKGR